MIDAMLKESLLESLTWEEFGFQSEDHPETDVRGGGVLGVLILSHLIET